MLPIKSFINQIEYLITMAETKSSASNFYDYKEVTTTEIISKGRCSLSEYQGYESRCMVNAIINKNEFFLDRGIHLNFKIGTLILTGTVDYPFNMTMRHFFGDNPMTEANFKENYYHCWLEDDKGNVYDHIQNNWLNIDLGLFNESREKIYLQMKRLPKGKRFEGMSKGSLKGIGLEYYACDNSDNYYQKIIFNDNVSYIAPAILTTKKSFRNELVRNMSKFGVKEVMRGIKLKEENEELMWGISLSKRERLNKN